MQVVQVITSVAGMKLWINSSMIPFDVLGTVDLHEARSDCRTLPALRRRSFNALKAEGLIVLLIL